MLGSLVEAPVRDCGCCRSLLHQRSLSIAELANKLLFLEPLKGLDRLRAKLNSLSQEMVSP